MTKKIESAMISVFYKDGLEPVVQLLNKLKITIYSTGGTQQFIGQLGIPVVPVEDLTSFPSILGGRVKTLHPAVFAGILGRRDNETDIKEMKQYQIPVIDLVIVGLYPFAETVAKYNSPFFEGGEEGEAAIIEKIDIGGPSMIRGAAKNFKDVAVIADKNDYSLLLQLLNDQNGSTTLEQRRKFAAKAFEIVIHYDLAIYNYFHPQNKWEVLNKGTAKSLRYGENPHQQAVFYGDLQKSFIQLHGKEISYNNLIDIDAAIQLISEAPPKVSSSLGVPIAIGIEGATFAIIKHTNVCGIASRSTVAEAWQDALAGDPESAFGGVLVCNKPIDKITAEAISEIFFEVLIADSFSDDALQILKTKKNRIILQLSPPRRWRGERANDEAVEQSRDTKNIKSILGGILSQDYDKGNFSEWKEVGERQTTETEKADLEFANIVCKHLKSNAIALVKNKQLIGKGCGQTSRIDALRQALEKARQFNFNLHGAVMASDAFLPFDDCVKLGHEAGITAFIQPGGSIRDNDSIEYCKQNNLAMVMTGMRHFKH